MLSGVRRFRDFLLNPSIGQQHSRRRDEASPVAYFQALQVSRRDNSDPDRDDFTRYRSVPEAVLLEEPGQGSAVLLDLSCRARDVSVVAREDLFEKRSLEGRDGVGFRLAK